VWDCEDVNRRMKKKGGRKRQTVKATCISVKSCCQCFSQQKC